MHLLRTHRTTRKSIGIAYLHGILSLCLLPLITLTASGQITMTIGSGTSTTSYGPVYTYYANSVVEGLFLPTELANAGWPCNSSGLITSISYYVNAGTSAYGGNFSIYMANTTATAISSTTFNTLGTLVYNVNPLPSIFTTPGWVTFNLQTPFAYTGGGLFVRCVRLGGVSGTYTYFRYTSTSPTSLARYGYSSSTTPTTGYTTTSRANVQITGTPADPPPTITVTNSPSCYSSAANQTVTATITDNVMVADAQIWYRKGTTGPWLNSTATSIVGSTYSFMINVAALGGVVNGDVVQWYLASQDNTGCVSSKPLGASGSTPPGSIAPATPFSYTVGVPRNLPYVETFDGAPSGVTFGGTSSSWRIGTPGGNIGYTAFSGTNALLGQNTSSSYSASENSWALLPAINIPAVPTVPPVLMFYQKRDLESCCDGVNIQYSTDCGVTWTTLGIQNDPSGINWYNYSSISASGGTPIWNGQYYSSWIQSMIPLPASLYGQSGVLFRFRFFSDSSVQYSGIVVDDIRIAELAAKDIEVVDARLGYAAGTWAHILNEQHTVKAVIKNNGYEVNPTSVPLTFLINGVPVATETVTPTWAGSTATVTFTAPAIPTTLGPMSLSVTANYIGDQQTSNNTYTRTYTIDDSRVLGNDPFANVVLPSFNPGWVVDDNNGGVTWLTTTSGSEMHLSYPGGEAADDWIFTPPAYLLAASSYRVQFQYRSTSGPQVLDLYYGTSPDEMSMTLIQSFTFSNTTWVNAQLPTGVAPYFNTDPAVSQNYYLGFRVRSGAVGALHIDNVILDENPTPPPKIGIGLPGTVKGQHIDNTATPLQFTAIYKKSGLVARTYEVVSTTYNYGSPGDFLWDVSTTTPWIRLTKSTAAATQFLPSNPYIPERPRQTQTFTLTVDPAGLIPGTYTGQITLVGTLYASLFPTGIGSTNEPFRVPVILTIIDPNAGAGSSGSQKACLNNMAVSPIPYVFKDANGNPMAAVTVTSGAIPSMCIEAFSGQLPQGISRYRYVQRYFKVAASGTWTATIDWYYADNEAVAGGVTRPDLLRTIRQPVAGGIWQDPVPGVISMAYPQLNYVRGMGYSNTTISGNHCLVTNWITPKAGAAPLTHEIGQNYPNPFNPTTSIDFAIPQAEHVQLVVINSLGEEVARLVDEERVAGSYTEIFDASTLPSGVYLYRITAGTFTRTLPMTLAK